MRRTLKVENEDLKPGGAGSLKAGKDEETDVTLEPRARKTALMTP